MNTSNQEKFWRERKKDWDNEYWSPKHPHRILIARELLKFQFKSVFEIGCGIGTNLTNIFSIFGKLGAEVGGTDEDPRAVEIARKNCPFARDIEVGTADDIFFSDKSIDIIITDATLMYVKNINKAIKEMATVSRNGVVLCELYSPSAFKRIKLRLKGFYAHDYKRLLEKNDFYDIQMTKIKDWPDSLWAEYGYIISAKI